MLKIWELSDFRARVRFLKRPRYIENYIDISQNKSTE